MADPRIERDEFYVGYLPEAPTGVARHTRRWVFAVVALAAGVAAALVLGQRPFDVAFFEFGSPRSFEGVIRLEPYPRLVVDAPGQGGGASSYYLVAEFKHGADAEVADLDGRRARLEGTLVYRDDQTMLEVVAGTAEDLGPAQGPQPRVESLGRRTVRGEIVDSKCYLGVMKPSTWKPHRACASLCIRGGIPPIVVVRRGDDDLHHLLLVGEDGRALGKEVLDFVAEPVEIPGEVVRMDDLWVLRAEPTSFKRLL
ncbi:MAG: hypothetical protein AAGN66_23260 [Acidobacteriota bacterium]